MSVRSLMWMILALVMFGAPCSAETVDADSDIVRVTVFPDRAEVTRQAVVKLDEGEYTLRFGNLPSQIDPASVSAKGEGDAVVTLYGVELVTTQLEGAQDPEVKRLEEAIRETIQQKKSLENTKKVLEQERKYLNSILAASSEQIGKDLITRAPSPSDAALLLDFLDESLLDNAKRDQEADIKLDALSRELDRLRRELAALTQGKHKQETAIQVAVDASEGGTFRLDVSYRLPGASWHPTYVARTDTVTDKVGLVSFAMIRQRTGENWENVELTLSTARPSIAGSMPELQSLFLRPWEPPVRQLRRDAAFGFAAAPAMKAVGDDLYEELDEEAKVAYAAIDAQGPSVTFRMPRKESIESDWQPHKAAIASDTFSAELAYEATPSLAPHAFLHAKAINTTNAVYLSGPVSVFLDGAFIATSRLKQIAPGEEFDLYLGVDERVKIEYKQLRAREEVSLLPGLRGKMKSIDYEYLTTVENYVGRRITISVFDRYPVSERDEITVESIQIMPKKIEEDPGKPGVFSWTVELMPSQKQEYKLSYRIRHPVNMKIR